MGCEKTAQGESPNAVTNGDIKYHLTLNLTTKASL